MADKAAETREFPITVTVDGVRVEVILTLKSTAVVTAVTATTDTPGATVSVGKPRDDG